VSSKQAQGIKTRLQAVLDWDREAALLLGQATTAAASKLQVSALAGYSLHTSCVWIRFSHIIGVTCPNISEFAVRRAC
jgi:hypothetical protein